jgi:regulator of replication initiation timing
MENSWEATIQNLDTKIRQLAAQNAHYKRICNDLLASKKQLEQENEALRQQAQPNPMPSQSSNRDVDFEQEKNFLKQQIQQHIQNIDACAEWIAQLP